MLRASHPLRLTAAATLGVMAVLLLGAGTAGAAGPGVVFKREAFGDTRSVSGAQIGGGMSIRALMTTARIDVSQVESVTVAGDDGNAIPLSGADFDSAFVSDNGTVTRFYRPGAPEDEVLSEGGPLEMTVNGSAFLSIVVTASPTNARVGQQVTLRARVKVKPPGASLVYNWSVGEATSSVTTGVDLVEITHSYESAGDKLVTVQIEGSGGTTPQCSPSCGGQGSTHVLVVGSVRLPDETRGLPGGTGTGTGSGTGGDGTGTGTGSGSGFRGGSSSGGRPAPKAPPQRVQRPESGEPFSADPQSGAGKAIVRGVLLNGTGKQIDGDIADNEAGGSPKAQQGSAITASSPSQIGAALTIALMMIWLGALQERRRVRLRLA